MRQVAFPRHHERGHVRAAADERPAAPVCRAPDPSTDCTACESCARRRPRACCLAQTALPHRHVAAAHQGSKHVGAGLHLDPLHDAAQLCRPAGEDGGAQQPLQVRPFPRHGHTTSAPRPTPVGPGRPEPGRTARSSGPKWFSESCIMSRTPAVDSLRNERPLDNAAPTDAPCTLSARL